jgi:hypothetical protein
MSGPVLITLVLSVKRAKIILLILIVKYKETMIVWFFPRKLFMVFPCLTMHFELQQIRDLITDTLHLNMDPTDVIKRSFCFLLY